MLRAGRKVFLMKSWNKEHMDLDRMHIRTVAEVLEFVLIFSSVTAIIAMARTI